MLIQKGLGDGEEETGWAGFHFKINENYTYKKKGNI